MNRIPVYAAERRTIDARGRVLARQDSFGFEPLAATGKSTEWGRVERDAADAPRLAIAVPGRLAARVEPAGGELWLCLYDGPGRLADFYCPRDAVEAATQGLHGLVLEAAESPVPAPGEGGGP